MPRKRASKLVRSAGRTAGRTALIAGTATAVSGRVARRQQGQAVGADQGHLPVARASDDLVARLQELAELRSSGALNDREFTAAKAKLLAT